MKYTILSLWEIVDVTNPSAPSSVKTERLEKTVFSEDQASAECNRLETSYKGAHRTRKQNIFICFLGCRVSSLSPYHQYG